MGWLYVMTLAVVLPLVTTTALTAIAVAYRRRPPASAQSLELLTGQADLAHDVQDPAPGQEQGAQA